MHKFQKEISTLGLMERLLSINRARFWVYHEIAKHIGLVDDLTSVWGADRANAVLSIAYQWLHTTSNAAYLYETW